MREPRPGRPLVFNHIPKTAGSSLRTALEVALRPEAVVRGWDLSLFGGYDDLDQLSPAVRGAVYERPEDLPAEATLVAGHIGPGTTMARYPDADHMTFLRAPQVRLLSQWLHSRGLAELDLRHWGRSAEAFRLGWLPLRDYLQQPMVAPNIDNTITRFLAWPHPRLVQTEFLDERHDDELLAAAKERLDAFAVVDLVENVRLLVDLGAWLGRALPDVHVNERTSVPPRRRPDLDQELDRATCALLDHRSRLDVQLWEHVARRVLPGTDPHDLLEATVHKAIDRYDAMLLEPHRRRPVRRVAEELYDARARLTRRLGAASPERAPRSPRATTAGRTPGAS